MKLEIVKEIIHAYTPITLKEMDGVELMNRTDTKFLVPLNALLEILQEMKSVYRVLEVQQVRLSHYETLYYDTKDLHFYMRHQNGKKNRWKIRKRSYVDSALSFLELKFKTNRGRTQKQRTSIPSIADELNIEENAFIDKKTGLPFELVPQLKNTFTRITLVEPNLPERITIDLDLAFQWQDRKQELPEVVIVEVKQESQNRRSPFVGALKSRLIRPESMSKYCLGIALLVPHVKRNSFKEKILKLKKFEPSITL
jgi:hypothetical protein